MAKKNHETVFAGVCKRKSRQLPAQEFANSRSIAQENFAKRKRTERNCRHQEAGKRARQEGKHPQQKLRDCRVHFNDEKAADRLLTTLFITEGDSASGSITKSRNPDLQAVFSLRGKPLNCYGMTKKVVYENEEFNLLQHALNIEDSIDNLRYNNIIVATDADVDGMHIRLLLLTFSYNSFRIWCAMVT